MEENWTVAVTDDAVEDAEVDDVDEDAEVDAVDVLSSSLTLLIQP